jgi:hypothetical protein
MSVQMYVAFPLYVVAYALHLYLFKTEVADVSELLYVICRFL